jgi:hypothetical protein
MITCRGETPDEHFVRFGITISFIGTPKSRTRVLDWLSFGSDRLVPQLNTSLGVTFEENPAAPE